VSDDLALMRRAIALARKALGTTAPNPAVGCVIVKDGQILAEGRTGAGGRPHGEEAALALLGGQAPGATAYVTLEPCAHAGTRGPACAPSLARSGIARCVIACLDPDPRTNGEGANILRAAGIAVEMGLGASEAAPVYAGFFKRIATGRPFVGVDESGDGYDSDFVLGMGESFEDALDRMGREGLMRVRVRPGSPLEAALASRGLLDQE
jgi:diaminohydroxyphosphoribosylaminopyrimidine deaminase/5-amino-6-(5-phosphoribosylamino)uracil reductase